MPEGLEREGERSGVIREGDGIQGWGTVVGVGEDGLTLMVV